MLRNLHYLALLSALRLTALLPFPSQIFIGRVLGRILLIIMKKRRHIADVNLKLCFPELSPDARKKLLKQVFVQNGIGALETALAWWKDPRLFKGRTEFIGLEHLEQALNKGKGVILLGAHYSTLDLGGLLVSLEHRIHAIYRPHNNPLMERYIRRGRLRCLTSLINRSDFRTVVRVLRNNEIVWYAPDQDFGERHSVFARFFGVQAATLDATAKLAKLSGASVVPIAHHRTTDNNYRVEFFPALHKFPTKVPEQSAQMVNESIERGIRYDITQYMWIHRRFKTQPNAKKGELYE